MLFNVSKLYKNCLISRLVETFYLRHSGRRGTVSVFVSVNKSIRVASVNGIFGSIIAFSALLKLMNFK